MPVTTANGIRIAYEVEGPEDGEPLLLVMGYGQQLVAWPRGFRAELIERGFRVIRFDNRDTGLSEKFEDFGVPHLKRMMMQSMIGFRPPAPYRLEDMADDAAGLVEALGIERAHVAGVSMGGAIAQLVAARHPEKTATLTSIMATSGRRTLSLPTPSATEVLVSAPRSHAVEDVAEHQVEMYRRIGSPKFPMDDVGVRESAREMYERCYYPQGLPRQFAAILATGSDRVPLLRKLDVPTLVVHGSEDPLIPPDHGEDVARLVPGARLEIVEGMGHNLPPGVWPILAGFIAEHRLGTDLVARRA